jgi:hypothetical protein
MAKAKGYERLLNLTSPQLEREFYFELLNRLDLLIKVLGEIRDRLPAQSRLATKKKDNGAQ